MKSRKRVLVTGAAGYVAGQLLPGLRARYDLVLLDATDRGSQEPPGEPVEIVDLIDPRRSLYARHFKDVDAVVHLAYKRRRGDAIDHFPDEKANLEMAYNVFRTASEAGVRRVVFASSNHAADWYEYALIHERKMEMVDPYSLPLSDNFYGWAKAAAEHMGFLFACGALGAKLEVVMVRIGSPRPPDVARAKTPNRYKRGLAAYISERDLTQLFVKCIEASDIRNRYGIPWHVVYGISDNTRAFWSLTNAREVFGYQPEDDSEVRFAQDIQSFLAAQGSTGRVGKFSL